MTNNSNRSLRLPLIRGVASSEHLNSLVSGSHWGQVAVNHLRERVNMTHVVLSIPAIVIAAIVVGIPFNWLLGGTRTAAQRIAIALVSVPATVGLAVVLFTFNALIPDAYAGLLRFADWIWQASYVIMALCSVLASFIVTALFALASRPRQPSARPPRRLVS